MSESIKNISNADVKWSGNYIGLSPTLSGDSTKHLIDLGELAIPELLRALADPDKFVTAHVILTQLSGVEYQSAPTWNGLAVEIAPDGNVTIDTAQRFDLLRRWEQWYRTKPTPTTLPPANT
jgi:hypothetical protein